MSTEISGLENVSFESSTTYTVLEEIGRGGMGIVYLAERTCMGVGDLVVLKTIRSISSSHEERLRKEANIATRLRHPNIVKTYGLEVLPYSSLPDEFRKGLEDYNPQELAPILERKRQIRRRIRRRAPRGAGQTRQRIRAESFSPSKGSSGEKRLILLCMNFVEGMSLHQLMQEHLRSGYLLPPLLSGFIISRICRALAYAHDHIVHRDVSPENILLDRHGVCQLTDFGIAVGSDESRQGIAGKVLYMPPEGLEGSRVDERGDIYSLGVCLYTMLTGILPYFSNVRLPIPKQIEEVRSQVDKKIPTPSELRPDIPEIISEVTMRMMETNAARRYPRIGPIGDEIERKFLYASGYGPTNGSLAAYLRIVGNRFTIEDEEDIGSLSFLRDEDDHLAILRQLRYRDFTKIGQKRIQDRPRGPMHIAIARLQKKSRDSKISSTSRRVIFKVRYGANLIEIFQPNRGDISIGRGRDNHCVLPDSSCSRQHAVLGNDNQSIFIEDLRSNNGTYVNNKRIEGKVTLEEGDRASFGRCTGVLMNEWFPDPPLKTFNLANGEMPDRDIIRNGDMALRMPCEDAMIEKVRELFTIRLAVSDIQEDLTHAISQSIEHTLEMMRDLNENMTEIRFFPAENRIQLWIREPKNSDRLKHIFNQFKKYLHPEAAGDSLILTTDILKAFDKIEFLPLDRTIRLSRNL